FALSQSCLVGLLSIPSPDFATVTDTFLTIMKAVSGAVPGLNFKVDAAIAGLSRTPQACSDYVSKAKTVTNLVKDTRVKILNQPGVSVVNTTQMVFQVNGKTVVPVLPEETKSNGAVSMVAASSGLGLMALTMALVV
ncbi:hypothetical protein HDU97_008118, partial [Phlyctochytrium planicorne]